MDQVFKALGDETRRFLLDCLRERNGQTLGELCERVAMTRQAATQHLALLEAANLISTTRRGRHKLHYLNPVPINEIQERWIGRFEQPRLAALASMKERAEMTNKPDYVYVTYIESTPERVWEAITDPELSASYWGHSNVSTDWKAGSRWEHRRIDGSGLNDGGGTIIESDPPRRLLFNWVEDGAPETADSERVGFEIEPYGDIVRLTVTHENMDPAAGAANGWPAVLANLKSLLETGKPLPQAPWEMPVRRVTETASKTS
ncbi:ArsR/SmtB family transcription factor [Microlunatus speluncae]|uniref:ArsR/SmtB family transcription factor n=1 Tax=Microlunatus speluncae TaxID=2594267 RepID=UPI0012665D04|nr:metalloregulator ArsR/SmtB family transcription factor [Microlunatus speluncae]